MRWTPEGAHLLIQVRTQVLNKEWANSYLAPNRINHEKKCKGNYLVL